MSILRGRKVTPAGEQAPEGLPGQSNAVHELQEQLDVLAARLEAAESAVAQLRETTGVLNRDLDESRRLNLRAAEVLDIAFAQIAK